MSHRILLVDRDVQNAEKRRAPLTQAGYEVEIAAGSAAAVDAFTRLQPQLVIIDAAEPEEAIRKLCGAIRQRDPRVPLALLTDVGHDPAQVALVLNQYSCDQLIDRSLAADRMLGLIAKLVGGATGGAPGQPAHGADPANGATLWLDSEELVSALEKLDTIITHTAAGRVKPGASSTPAVLAHVDEETNRDVPEAAERPVSEDRGTDIDAHLDSVFTLGLPASNPPAPPPPGAPSTTKATPTVPTPRGSTAQVWVRPATTHPTPRVATSAPVSEIVRSAAKAAEPTRRSIAGALAAQESLLRSSSAPSASEPASALRWIVAATIIVTLLGAGYLLWFRGGADAPASVAQGGNVRSDLPPFTPAAPDRASDDESTSRSSAGQVAAPAAPVATPAPVAAPPPMTSPPPTTKPVVTTVATAAPPPRASARPPRSEATASKPAPPPTPRPAPSTKPAQVGEPVAITQGVPQAVESAPAPTTAPEATATAALVPREEPRIPIEPAPPAAAPTREPLFEPPVAIARVEPSYPKKALKGVTDPRVVLKLLVDDRGRITRVLVDKGLPGSELEAAAVSAVLRWQFRPAQRDGAPVEGWATAEFVFGE